MEPNLCLSLWSIREQIAENADNAFKLINKWNVKEVELASFFGLTSVEFIEILKNNNLKVASIIGPPITKDRDIKYYFEFYDKYLKSFKFSDFVIQTLPNSISHKSDKQVLHRIVNTVHELISFFNTKNIRLNYHSFPHDFELINKKERLFDLIFKDKPINLGLQLDTYWLARSNYNISDIIENNTFSIHLNETSSDGKNCIIGSDPLLSFSHLYHLNIKNKINWILENDPISNVHDYNEANTLEIIRKCFTDWPNIYNNFIKYKNDFNNSKAVPFHIDPKFEYFKKTENLLTEDKIYSKEIRDAFTPNLIDIRQFNELPYNFDIIEYYINKRKNNEKNEAFKTEFEFTKHFLPGNEESEQIILLEGDAGIGKSTFITFYFRYYIHHLALLKGNELGSPSYEIHKANLQKHIFLYLDLRAGKQKINNFKEWVCDLLINAIKNNNKILIIDSPHILPDNLEKKMHWIKYQFEKNTNYHEKDTYRRKYITMIFDNSDQLGYDLNIELFNYFKEFIDSSIPSGNPIQPTHTGQKREIWRIIMPIRTETKINLIKEITPFKNLFSFKLPPINLLDLFNSRINLLKKYIYDSGKLSITNISSGSKIRDLADFVGSTEAISIIRKDLLLPENIVFVNESGKEPNLVTILNNLINNSARRRIELMDRLVFNKIHAFQNEGNKFSKYNYLEGLIKGKNDYFNDDPTNILLINLFDTTGLPEGSIYTILIGLHSIYFLKKNIDWENCKIYLNKLKYPTEVIDMCELSFITKEIIRNSASKCLVSYSIVDAYYRLLQERAYLDNMILSYLAEKQSSKSNHITSCLNPDDFILRIQTSLNFFKVLCNYELKIISIYSSNYYNKKSGIDDIISGNSILNIPTISSIILKSYISNLQVVITSKNTKKKVKEVIYQNIVIWNRIIDEFNNLYSKVKNSNIIIYS